MMERKCMNSRNRFTLEGAFIWTFIFLSVDVKRVRNNRPWLTKVLVTHEFFEVPSELTFLCRSLSSARMASVGPSFNRVGVFLLFQ